MVKLRTVKFPAVGHAMRKQPVFRSLRLTLTPARQEHLRLLHACWNHPDVRRYLFDDYEVTQSMAQGLLDHCLSAQNDGLGLWVISLRDDDTFIGCAGLYPVGIAAHYEPRLTGLLEPLVALDPKHWHGGYAREALRELLDYGFITLDRPTIAAVNDAPNLASERMLLKTGFTLMSQKAGPRHMLHTYTQDTKNWIQVRTTI